MLNDIQEYENKYQVKIELLDTANISWLENALKLRKEISIEDFKQNGFNVKKKLKKPTFRVLTPQEVEDLFIIKGE